MDESASLGVIFSNYSIFVILIIFIIILLNAIGRVECMQKAGEKGWKAFIPIYSTYVMYKIVGIKSWLIIPQIIAIIISCILFGIESDCIEQIEDLQKEYSETQDFYKKIDIYREGKSLLVEYSNKVKIIEIVSNIFWIFNLVIAIFYAIYIAQAYGKGGGYIAGMILVPFIFSMILGFGDSEYIGNYIPKNKKIYM